MAQLKELKLLDDAAWRGIPRGAGEPAGDPPGAPRAVCSGLAKNEVETALAAPASEPVDERMARLLEKKRAVRPSRSSHASPARNVPGAAGV